MEANLNFKESAQVRQERDQESVVNFPNQKRSFSAFSRKAETQAGLRPAPSFPVERLFFLNDFFALVISFMMGGAGAWLIDNHILHTPLQNVITIGTLEAFVSFLFMGLLALLWLDSKGHYVHRLPYWETASHLFGIAAIGFGAGGFVQFSAKSEYSRLWLGLSWVCFVGLIFTGRGLLRLWLTRQEHWQLPTLVIGEGAGAVAAAKVFAAEPHMGYRIVDTLPAAVLDDLATTGSWRRLMEETGARHIVMALPDYKLEFYQEALKALVYDRISYSIVPAWSCLPTSTLSTHYFFTQGVAIMHHTNRLQLLLPRLIKRSFDIAASSAALIALSPLFVMVSLLVRRDGGPALYGHKRLGRNGKAFACLKFRSMVPNGDEVLKRHLAENPEAMAEWQREHKLKNDPRVTRIGRILRAASLDELPQLVNVLKGEMSLVGPRPIVAAECVKYDSDIALYYMVRPGLTGLWQISGRNDVSYAERVNMDSLYVRNWSFWHDIAIIFKTVPALLKRTGAY